MLVLIKTIYI